MEIVGAIAGLAASGQAAKAHKEAGRADAAELRAKAVSVQNKADEEEILRLQKLRLLRGTQSAYFAAAGIDSTSGSAETIANRSLETFNLDQGAALLNTRSLIRSYNNQAINSIKMAKYKARGSLLSGFSNFGKDIAASASSSKSSSSTTYSSGNPHQ